MPSESGQKSPSRSYFSPYPGVRSARDVLLAFALLVLPFLYPGVVIFSAESLLGADGPQFHLPHQSFIRDYFCQGVIPFWNPCLYAGTPEFGNPEMAPMYPFHFFPLLLFGPEFLMKFKFLFHLGLLGAGAFLLLRFWSVGSVLAAAGALTLQISGFPVTKITLPNVGDSAAWSPLILLCTEVFRKRLTLNQGLWFALIAGVCLLLFFPQITLTIALLSALFSTACFLKIRTTRRTGREGVWIDRFVLPVVELFLIGSLLRYPPEFVPFPEPGWRCAFNGMGRIGLLLLLGAGGLWFIWLIRIRMRFRFQGHRIVLWIFSLALVWGVGALFAAPQLAVTGEMIPQSNQTALAYIPENYFTGAQAFGSVREFITHSVLATRKESVNNMALGPLPWVLLLAGIAGGFQRRHRPFALLLAGTGLILLVYMAAPGVFEVFIHLPFFNKFAGLSRYLAFLNLGVVLLATLSSALWLRRMRGRVRMGCVGLLVAGFFFNTALLVRHQIQYWAHLTSQRAESVAPEVAQMVRAQMEPNMRILSDGRDPNEYVPALMFSQVYRFEGLQGYGPIRPARYDAWLRAHNRSLGVSHDDYRAPVFEPIPSRWTRALGVTGFLYPPGAGFIPELGRRCPPSWNVGIQSQWRLEKDPGVWPCVWPVSNPCDTPDDLPEIPTLPYGWLARRLGDGPNRVTFLVHNPGPDISAALAMPWYPGWWISVNEAGKYSGSVYGFLQRADLKTGDNRIELEFRPLSFVVGWLVFLWTLSAWIILRIRTSRRNIGQPSQPPDLSGLSVLRPVWIWVLPGICLTILAAPRVFFAPDALVWRVGELGVVVGVSWVWSLLVTRLRKEKD